MLISQPVTIVAVIPPSNIAKFNTLPLILFSNRPVGNPTIKPIKTGRKIITGIMYSGSEPPFFLTFLSIRVKIRQQKIIQVKRA